VLRLGQLLEIRHSDAIRTQSKLN